MSQIGRQWNRMQRVLRTVVHSPAASLADAATMRERLAGETFAHGWTAEADGLPAETAPIDAADLTGNPLRRYFDSVKNGPGIFKWLHYFEFYHRHLQKFVGQKPTVVEVGIYSGGSLPMWHDYFGAGCQVHGVDIIPACKAHEAPGTRVHIGDQADREFWTNFRKEVPRIDVFVDDGGHTYDQQRATLEEMLPHLAPGGVFICEDVHKEGNKFTAYLSSLIDALNAFSEIPGGEFASQAAPFQGAIHSIHSYPFAVVIEKHAVRVAGFQAPKHGSQWQPLPKK